MGEQSQSGQSMLEKGPEDIYGHYKLATALRMMVTNHGPCQWSDPTEATTPFARLQPPGQQDTALRQEIMPWSLHDLLLRTIRPKLDPGMKHASKCSWPPSSAPGHL